MQRHSETNVGFQYEALVVDGFFWAAGLHILAVCIHLFKNFSAGVRVGRSAHGPAGVVMTLLQPCQLRIGPTEASFI